MSPERPAGPPLQRRFATVADALRAAGGQYDHEAYVEGDQRLTFAEWLRRADGLAAELVARGIQPGDVVAVMLPSSIDYAVAYAAIQLAGGIATGINTRLGPREVGAIVRTCRPALVLRDGGDDGPLLDGSVPVMTRDEVRQAQHRDGLGDARPSRDPSDPAVIIWTSGTTGVPKGAWFDHRNLEAAVHSAGIMSRPYDRRLVGTPFAHAGYMAKLWVQLAWGSTIVISPTPWRVDDMLDLIVYERITVVGGVPTQWSKLLDHPRLDGADLSHVRLCLAATAPASRELGERVTERFGKPMVVRYAMTECPSITGTEPSDPSEVLLETVGRPQAGVELLLANEDGSEVPAGQVGRVRVRGRCVMRGYWNAPELTAAAFSDDGWLVTSDLGYLREDGNLVLVGRANDMYLRGGYNVYPLEVEHVLMEHPAVDKAAVVGVPRPVIGQIGVAFIVPRDARKPPSLEELRSWTVQRLADYKAPDELEVLDELPLTSMLKVDKAALLERAGHASSQGHLA